MHASPEALSRLEVCAEAKICCLDHGIIGRGGQQKVLRLDVPAIKGPVQVTVLLRQTSSDHWSRNVDMCRQVAGEQFSRVPGQSRKAGKLNDKRVACAQRQPGNEPPGRAMLLSTSVSIKLQPKWWQAGGSKQEAASQATLPHLATS